MGGGGYPQTCLIIGGIRGGGGVTQTYVVAILDYQSTHAIYHIKGNCIFVLMMYCMMQWIEGISLRNVETCFLLQNNRNRQQNKLANMVNKKDLIKHDYWPYIYLTYVFRTQMCSHQSLEVLPAQFSLYVHKGGLKPDSFHLPRCVFA